MKRRVDWLAAAIIVAGGALLARPEAARATYLPPDGGDTGGITYCCRAPESSTYCCFSTGCRITSSGCIRLPA